MPDHGKAPASHDGQWHSVVAIPSWTMLLFVWQRVAFACLRSPSCHSRCRWPQASTQERHYRAYSPYPPPDCTPCRKLAAHSILRTSSPVISRNDISHECSKRPALWLPSCSVRSISSQRVAHGVFTHGKDIPASRAVDILCHAIQLASIACSATARVTAAPGQQHGSERQLRTRPDVARRDPTSLSTCPARCPRRRTTRPPPP